MQGFLTRTNALKRRPMVPRGGWGFSCALILALLPFCRAPEAQAEVALLSWVDWYPLDRGQAPGQRALNYWSDGVFDPTSPYNLHGQSTLNYPGTPATLPPTFNGRTVDYFLNWVCTEPRPTSASAATSADCRINEKTYVEIMSQGTATGSAALLEHWAHGYAVHWRVYYHPTAFSRCAAGSIGGDLTSPENKAPLIMALPAVAGEEAVGNIVCGVTYDQTYPDPAHVMGLFTGLSFVVTTNMARSVDAHGVEVIQARNEYYSDNPAWAVIFNYYCAREYDPRYCANGGVKTRVHAGVTGYLYDVEDYWMRQVEPQDRLTNGLSAYIVDPGQVSAIIRDDVEPNTNIQRWIMTGY